MTKQKNNVIRFWFRCCWFLIGAWNYTKPRPLQTSKKTHKEEKGIHESPMWHNRNFSMKCVRVGSITKPIDKISVFLSNDILQDVQLSNIHLKKKQRLEKSLRELFFSSHPFLPDPIRCMSWASWGVATPRFYRCLHELAGQVEVRCSGL